MKFSQKDQDFLCSAGFVAMGAAQLIFRKVYQCLEDAIDEEASNRIEYKKLKKNNPAAAKLFREKIVEGYFTDEQRKRYRLLMTHIELLMRDFEWVDSYAMLEHIRAKLTPAEYVNLFDSMQTSTNDLARLIFYWADWQDNHPEDKDDIMLESYIKNNCKDKQCIHLADIFRLNSKS